MNPIATLHPYQVDHLFLLIGGNTPPNCVAALGLLRPNGTAYLIHTQFSKVQADRLADILRDRTARFDKFEFDVAFMRHYQLFVLSCTTRKLCKQKLIEANTRARQLGGTEARVALVCARSDADSLRKELEVATRNRKIAVFGRQDWSNLNTNITDWVKQNI